MVKMAEALTDDVKTFAAQDQYETLDDPSRIIESDIAAKILVNAAPGSGKTHTVIRRLEYIIRNQMAGDFSGVLVLTYTNAAKNEIQSRLKLGVPDGSLPNHAGNMDVCTFDSLATSYLAAIGVPFGHLDYDERIRLFNDKFADDNFSNFEYVIVDELQDLVNERAEMVLNILGALKGGYLLLGDKCQAIYDYDCHDGDSVDSAEFYKRLDELFPPDILKYELSGNQRQTDRLAAMSNNLRRALLCFEPRLANELIADELKQIQAVNSVDMFDFSDISKRTAILCRNNGEAEYVSHLFHKKHVKHTLLRSVAQTATLRRFIADCLWDYHADSRMTRKEFVGRFRARITDDDETANNMFDALSEAAYGDTRQAVEMEKLARTLCDPAAKLPDSLLNDIETMLTVSTVHKAKGREFDAVYLLDSDFSPDDGSTEEARVWYVGCTRAKAELYRLSGKNLYLKRSSNYIQRWTRQKFHSADRKSTRLNSSHS
jgi:superfamily I DNA/RNA helicase